MLGDLKPVIAAITRRDLPNLLRYGRHAPLWCERIWIDPGSVVRRLSGFSDTDSGRVVGGDWDQMAVPLETHHKMRSAIRHWSQREPWEATEAIDRYLEDIEIHGIRDGCRTLADVEARLAELDRIFEAVRCDGWLRTRAELQRGRAFRERGGIRIHISRRNEPIFGGSGYHRLAIATVLEFERIPAQLGVVHPLAIRSWRKLYGGRHRIS